MRPRLTLLFLTILIIGCSTSDETVKRNSENYDEVRKFVNEVNLELDENVCWINVMPGTTPKFHVSGKITLLKGDDYSDETKLKYVKIFQSGSEIYYIMPKVVANKFEGSNIITYSTIKGLSISQNLDRKKPVTFELVFVDDTDELRYRINNVIVEEVQ